jgi:TonB-dependent starch-binding outer membrane protein SusC
MFKKRLTMQISKSVRRIALFFLSMVLSSSIIFAQEKTITGKVTGQGEGPLTGVNVTVQGTTVGAITDLNGSYSIKVPNQAAVLTFSSIGYVTKQVVVGTQTVIDMVLQSDVTALSEVVVTGYTTQRRRDLTGSVATVQPAELTAVPVANVSNQLQGRTAGVTVVGNGMPGSTSTVRIRGFGSFQDNDPLYVVDGVPTQDISSMNPNDVESISVLKDAGAASIYGSRASNGVIIVTTKKGNKGTKVTYDMYYGTQDPGNGPKGLCNTQQMADLQWLVYANDGTNNDGKGVLNAIYGSSLNATPTLPSWAANTNWYKAVTNSAPIMNHDVTFSGGSDKAKFFGGFGYFSQDGIVKYTHNDKFTARFNSDYTFLNDHVKVGENVTMAYRNTLGVTNLGEGSPIQMGAYREQPIIPAVIPAGETIAGTSHTYVAGDWGGTGIVTGLGNATNPLANLTRSKNDKYHDIRLIGNAFLDVKILDGLNFRSNMGGTWNDGWGVALTQATYENSENTGTTSLNENSYYNFDWVWTNTLTFDKTFGQHKILAVAGYEAVNYGNGRALSGNRANYYSTDPNYLTLDNGVTLVAANSEYNTPTTLVSQFARADYSFMDRYMLSATIRRDGSSRFGNANRYGIFPSFSAGWRISNEPFFQGISFINDLKLRGSYGTMGNQLAVSPTNQYYTYGGSQSTSFYDINGTSTSSVQGFRQISIGNPDAKWETSINADFGFEATVLNNAVGIKLDYYNRKTKDLLYNPELPGVEGASTPPFINVASMTNKGIDLELSYKHKWGDFGFDGGLVLSTVDNKITKITDGITFFDSQGGVTRIGGNSNNRNMVGHPMSEFFGYKVIGLFQSAADVASSPTQDGAAPGFLKFQDTNGDGKITADDRTFIGNPNPKFTYGINLAFNYKNFDLVGFLYGTQGNDIFNWNKYFIDFWPSFQGEKSTALLYDSWTPTNTGAKVPMATNTSNFSTNTQVNSYYIEKGSYLRMKTLQLGYTIPGSVLSKISIKSLRVYIQTVNLFTITKYSGLDPELGGSDLAHGSDTGNYPNVKQYIFGLQVSF